MEEKKESLRDKILSEYKKGNIVFTDFEGFRIIPLKEFIEQPIEGLLYDLNRRKENALSFIDIPKWVNDYAVYKIIRALKERIEELEKELDL